jgi:hypothetical protein
MISRGQIESEILHVALGGPRRSPINLLEVARDIGVGDIRPTTLRDGFTDFNVPMPVIYQNRFGPRSRVRAVFAHELAHVMLRMPEVVRLIEMRGQASLMGYEEALADRLAAAMLVPDTLIDELGRSDLQLDQLEDVAAEARVPIGLLIARLASASVDVALLQWRRGRRTWHVIDRTGVPPILCARIAPLRRGHAMLETMPSAAVAIVLSCAVSGHHVELRGIAIGRGENVIHFLRPSRDVRICSQTSDIPVVAERGFQAGVEPVRVVA